MKLRCEILTANGNFPDLELTLQGKQKGAACWRSARKMTLIVPMHDRTARAFFVGRMITVEVKT